METRSSQQSMAGIRHKSKQKRFRLNIMRFFFPMRAGRQWSGLPREAVPALSLELVFASNLILTFVFAWKTPIKIRPRVKIQSLWGATKAGFDFVSPPK
ncbi:hypothetical protein QYF61_002208 [Mycteria americana]|uniref:Uncharacterized protein n=1 Tax=Mycteria americana TaxID=33587 RepID=A0AAN7S1W2_MYCAM|nr:hypothetical protein QYF61_002208 [Mycteria americana]